MALPVKQQLTYWGATAAVIFLLLWVLGDVILPFVLGGAIAYFLDPVADRLEKLGFSRLMATVTITTIACLIFIVAALLVIPTLLQQTFGLVEAAPDIAKNLSTFLTEKFPALLDTNSRLYQSLVSVGETIQAKGGAVISSVISSAAGLVNVLVLVILVPVVTFYLLMDWDRIVARVDALLPRDHAPVIRQLAAQVDETLASFIRGQGTVVLILGAYYGLGLMLVGLQFGLVVGVVAGLISFIPYIGALVGGVLALGLALFQFWGDWVWIGAVAGIFMIGQVLEGNFLTPKLVGGSVGLHPVWLIFALSAFGTLFGFVGMLVAVPVAASLGVFARFATLQYQGSLLFKGLGEKNED